MSVFVAFHAHFLFLPHLSGIELCLEGRDHDFELLSSSLGCSMSGSASRNHSINNGRVTVMGHIANRLPFGAAVILLILSP